MIDLRSSAPCSTNSWPENTESAIGVSCSVCSRFCAVTTISSITPSLCAISSPDCASALEPSIAPVSTAPILASIDFGFFTTVSPLFLSGSSTMLRTSLFVNVGIRSVPANRISTPSETEYSPTRLFAITSPTASEGNSNVMLACSAYCVSARSTRCSGTLNWMTLSTETSSAVAGRGSTTNSSANQTVKTDFVLSQKQHSTSCA